MQKKWCLLTLLLLNQVVLGQWTIDDRAEAFLQTSGIDTVRHAVKGHFVYFYFNTGGDSFVNDNLEKITDKYSPLIKDCVLDGLHNEAVIVYEHRGRKKKFYRSTDTTHRKTVEERIKVFEEGTPYVVQLTHVGRAFTCKLYLPKQNIGMGKRFGQGACKITRHYVYRQKISFRFIIAEPDDGTVYHDQLLMK